MRSHPNIGAAHALLRARAGGGARASAVALALLAPAAIQAQDAAPTAPAASCSIQAYAQPPQDHRVRAAPDRKAATVGRLRATRYDADDIEGAYVTVVALENGWAKIADAPAPNELAHPVPAGWVPTDTLGLVLQTRLGFAAPNPASAVVHREEDDIGRRRIQRFLGCSGEWLHLRIRGLDGRSVTGWFRGACANQRTSCDGVPGDWPPAAESAPPGA